MSPVRVELRNPRREVDVAGPVRVRALLERLGLDREAHLVIANGTLVPGDAELTDGDVVEIRPVVSGG
jgi:sulfur carrier protein